ncbi:MAG: hypothetical protein ACI9MC_001496 [Kiritimatiellia bacterium]|jgi:hypothetical protein
MHTGDVAGLVARWTAERALRGELERELERSRAQAAVLIALLAFSTEKLGSIRQTLNDARVQIGHLNEVVGPLS